MKYYLYGLIKEFNENGNINDNFISYLNEPVTTDEKAVIDKNKLMGYTKDCFHDLEQQSYSNAFMTTLSKHYNTPPSYIPSVLDYAFFMAEKAKIFEIDYDSLEDYHLYSVEKCCTIEKSIDNKKGRNHCRKELFEYLSEVHDMKEDSSESLTGFVQLQFPKNFFDREYVDYYCNDFMNFLNKDCVNSFSSFMEDLLNCTKNEECVEESGMVQEIRYVLDNVQETVKETGVFNNISNFNTGDIYPKCNVIMYDESCPLDSSHECMVLSTPDLFENFYITLPFTVAEFKRELNYYKLKYPNDNFIKMLSKGHCED